MSILAEPNAAPRLLARRRFMAAAGGVAATALIPPARADEGSAEAAWKALADDGAVALVRHAKAPGPSPDPPGARLEDCSTQRNLSAEGRAQATKLGELWRARRVKVGKVISSPWCRCIDTARLMGLGEPAIDHALYNLLANPPDREAKIDRLRALIRLWKGPGALVLVTHGITMRAVVGSDPGEAGVVVARPDRLHGRGYVMVGAIPPP
jgi:phosphohistidine phosphatase SixA